MLNNDYIDFEKRLEDKSKLVINNAYSGNTLLVTTSIWHNRLTHVFHSMVNKVLNKCDIKVSSIKEDVCKACVVTTLIALCF